MCLTLSAQCRVKLDIDVRHTKSNVEIKSTLHFTLFFCWFSISFCYPVAAFELFKITEFMEILFGADCWKSQVQFGR